MSQDQTPDIESIAIVGMAGRFPEARDLEELWHNLTHRVDCIRDLTDDELRKAGLDPATLPPNYVRCDTLVDGIEMFDASFFGFSAREAEILDPQSRVFLECAWEALESAGLSGEPDPGWIGVFAGVSLPTYYLSNLLSRPELAASMGGFQLLLANERDYFATRVSYKLDLRGPSVNVQTACSTSLVAVHMACQSLLAYQCTAAIAGGVRLSVPQGSGYVAQEGSIFSPDGRCRSYDAKGAGALFGDGAGVVVLKRLSDALADGDPIHAVIRGSAWNNDGSMKVGYTAPSIEGQAECIALAQAVAGVDPATITFVEGHGSGTPLGDPIEVSALTQAFRAGTDATGFCALGSIKSNVGHLEAAAGIAGLIKATLAMEREAIPPNCHFETPNPQIDFANSPFYVPTEVVPWPRNGQPRRAGVSSFGMGGTNVHAILEEAPVRTPSGPSRAWQLLNLSARTPLALEAMTERLAEWLAAHPEADVADVAHTLHTGRRTFRHRRAILCRDREDALSVLRSRDPRRVLGSVQDKAERPVVFLLPGLGDHYAGMTLGLYRAEPTFRAEIDRAAELLRAEGLDLLGALYPKGTGPDAEEVVTEGGADLRALLGRGAAAGTGPLDRTEIAQPAVFAVEMALAKLVQEWGFKPRALAGYSLGEYTAACLAGVFSFEDGLRLVARRARLIANLPAGSMLSVALPEEEARELATGNLSLAAVNGPVLSVLAGPSEEIDALAARLAERGVATRRLPTTHAFHSKMMEPLRGPLRDLLRTIRLAAPEIPYLSNVTGTWITDAEATDPEHWVRHLVEPVRFGAILTELLAENARVFLEVGPGQGLTALALQLAKSAPVAVQTVRATWDRQPDQGVLLGALSRLWLAGLPVDWAGFSIHERRQKLRLPGYPFEKKRYWIERANLPRAVAAGPAPKETEGEMPEEVAAAALDVHDRPANLRNAYVAPEGELETSLVGIWESLLGVAPIGIHDSFFELGGHSLLAPQLLIKLRQAFGIDFPMRDLFESPTISELAKAVDLVQREGAEALAASREVVDLRAEAVLDPSIRPEGPQVTPTAAPAEVFLTGSTGFLGAHLLDELLHRTGARVHCLVRAADNDQALHRVREALESRKLWRDGLEDRLVAWAGELGEPRFGLGEETFQDLAARVDAVYHCGAWVNFTYPYKVLKPSNVEGTLDAIRLASAVRAKPLHFISSIASLPEVEYGFRDDPTVFENDRVDSLSGVFGGYGETKWVSERLCEQARERGLPVNIYRPGVLSGDSRTGIGNTRDMVWNVIKGNAQLGIAPEGSGSQLDVTPVDYVAASVVHISLQDGGLNRVYHFPHPRIPSFQVVYDFMQRYGYQIERLPRQEWERQVLERLRTETDNALAPFLPVIANYQAYAETAAVEGRTGIMKHVLFDDHNTQEKIAGTEIACPEIDDRLLQTYFDWFVDSGFLPPPQNRPAAVEPQAVGAAG